jgi:2-polyprenyl-6-hydroxyphenyl methylase/3-demethylubiquinone-9 3-methyltransferase
MLCKDVLRPTHRAGLTADPVEIARFDSLAEEWWKPDGKFKVVHGFNAARVDLIIEALRPLGDRHATNNRALSGLNVADVGCGVGIISESLAKAGASVTGIDASAQSIGIARRHAELAGLAIDYRCALPEQLLSRWIPIWLRPEPERPRADRAAQPIELREIPRARTARP